MPRKFLLEDFDNESRAVLKAAQDMAMERNHSHVDIPHFVLAWLRRDGVERRLTAADVDVVELRRRLSSILEHSPAMIADQVFVGRPLLACLERVALRHVVADDDIPFRDVVTELVMSDTKAGAVVSAAGINRELVRKMAAVPIADRLTNEARACLKRATSIAAERRHAAVTPAHILLAALTGGYTTDPPVDVIAPVEAHLGMLPTELAETRPALDDDCLAVLESAYFESVGPAELVRAVQASGFDLLMH